MIRHGRRRSNLLETRKNLHFLDRVDRLLGYLDEHYQVGSFGKIHEIRKLCQDIVQTTPDQDLSIDWHFSQYQSALEFLTVCDFYRSNNILLERSFMRKVCSGHLVSPTETGVSQDRDFFLEMKAARYFLAAGFEVDLSGDADLLVTGKDSKIYIECKRLWSEKNALKQIRRAGNQIEKRLEGSSKKSTGWIYVDASHLINEGKLPYPYRCIEAPLEATRIELRKLLRDLSPSVMEASKKGASQLILTSSGSAVAITTKEVRPLTTTISFSLNFWTTRWQKQAAKRVATMAANIDYLASSAMLAKQ